METLIFTFLFMLIVVAAMAVGVIFGHAPIKGSCGGISQLGLGECEICGARSGRCLDENAAAITHMAEVDFEKVVNATPQPPLARP